MAPEVALDINLEMSIAFFLLETKSYSCLTGKLQKAIIFNLVYGMPHKNAKVNNFLALLRRIVKKFCEKPDLTEDEENLLMEVFKCYQSCVAESKIQIMIVQDIELLLDMRSLLKRQQDTQLRHAILRLLNGAMFLCKADYNTIYSVFFDEILFSLERRWCLKESSEAFQSLSSLHHDRLGAKEYELIITLQTENPEHISLEMILKLFLLTENFWGHFPSLEFKCRNAALLCALDSDILRNLSDNSVETIVDCFNKCSFKLFDRSQENYLKFQEITILLQIVKYLINDSDHFDFLQTNTNLLLGCATMYNNIQQLKRSESNLPGFIDSFSETLMDIIEEFPEESKQDMMFLSAFVN